VCRLSEYLALYQSSLFVVNGLRRTDLSRFLIVSLQPSFFSEFLLRLFEDFVVDHSV